ncbi:hypothetical protein BGX21_011572 [Mortierella sp. AD011]|nr:hypothetical protein BGX21_011572 [Mortierella sp. AD011]
MALTLSSQSKHFGGTLSKYTHASTSTKTTMTFNVFVPEGASAQNKVPVLYCLGGLTATEDNFAQKAGFGARASQYGIALVFPDTSPRDVGFPEAGEIADIGYSAGFYLNATKAPWDKNWKMYDYVSKELPEVIAANLPISVSAFAPILHPVASSWGMYAFPRYLGMDQYTWKQYDTVELIKRLVAEKNLRSDVEFLIDQGTGDQFLNPDRLHTSVLAETIKSLGIDNQFNIRYHDGYDHGYFFISTFINDHIDHHAKALGLSLKH